MKKLYIGFLIGILSLSLIACGKKADAPDAGQVADTEQVQDASQTGDGQADADNLSGGSADDTIAADDTPGDATDASAGGTNVAQEGTPAKVLLADFQDRMDAGQIKGTEEMANALLTNAIIPFQGAVMPVQPGGLTGFSDEIKGFSEGTMFSPVIGAIPFVGYIFKTDDADALVSDLKAKADKRWNICTEADEMICEAQGDMVFFVMAPAEFEE